MIMKLLMLLGNEFFDLPLFIGDEIVPKWMKMRSTIVPLDTVRGFLIPSFQHSDYKVMNPMSTF